MSKLLLVVILFVAIAMIPHLVVADTCYSSALTAESTCTDGTITSDSQMSDGCRQITCTKSVGNFLTIKACNKPGNYQSQFFEMYRVNAQGSVPEICVAGTCLRDNGYVKSSSFPICTVTASSCGDGIVTAPEQCDGNAPDGFFCTDTCKLYEYPKCDLLPTLSVGESYQFNSPVMSYNISIENVTNNSTVLDFNGSAVAELTYSNMIIADTDVTTILLWDTNVSSHSATICIVTGSPKNATMSVAPSYPQNSTVVFTCDVSGFVATDYSWWFDDGTNDSSYTGAITHQYKYAGSYIAQCKASNNWVERSSGLMININGPQGPVTWNYLQPANNNVTLQQGQTMYFGYSINRPASVAESKQYYLDGVPIQQSVLSPFHADTLGIHYLTLHVSTTANSLSNTWIITVVKNSTNTTNTTNTTQNCYNSVANITPTCTGGTLQSDTPGGCRTLVCANGANNLQVLACDKPSNTNPIYFEMYKQSSSGTGLKICLGTTCISDNGYAKSTNYPICTNGTTTNNTNTTDTTPPIISNGQPSGVLSTGTTSTTISVTTNEVATCRYSTSTGIAYNSMTPMTDSNTMHTAIINGLVNGISYNYYVKCKDTIGNTNTQDYLIHFSIPQLVSSQCKNSVYDLPASCTSGSITQDTITGCRIITCVSTTGTIQTMACNKPSDNNPQYFEMYKQTSSGYGVDVCIAGTCLANSGYAKSPNFPICFNGTGGGSGGGGGNSTNNTNTTNNTPSLIVQIAPWFPQGRSYVFICNATGWTPANIEWYFGDGGKQTNTNRADIYYTYANPGTYTVECDASQAGINKNATLQVTVT